MHESVAQFLFIACGLSGLISGISGLIYSFRAANDRQPSIRFSKALGVYSIIFHPERYTGQGLEARRKVILSLFLFIIFFILGVTIGSLTGIATFSG